MSWRACSCRGSSPPACATSSCRCMRITPVSLLCNLLLQVHTYTSCFVPTCCRHFRGTWHPSDAVLVSSSDQHGSTPAGCVIHGTLEPHTLTALKPTVHAECRAGAAAALPAGAARRRRRGAGPDGVQLGAAGARRLARRVPGVFRVAQDAAAGPGWRRQGRRRGGGGSESCVIIVVQ
jgi:hypothetical protein